MTVHAPATAGPGAGATSHQEVDWSAIDWRQAHRAVRRLQARSVQATQDGKPGKGKALQRLLTHACSGTALAVRRVTEQRGKRTPGVDGATWDTPAKQATAVRDLRQRGDHPRPLRRVRIPKSNGTLRPLGIATLRDRAMHARSLLALAPIAETTGDPHAYGFRQERATADALAQCCTVLSGENAAPWILEGDSTSCFDRISHDWLLAHVPLDQVMLRQWLQAGCMERHVVHATEEGTPHGGSSSPVLANLALDGLEQRVHALFPSGRARQRAKGQVIRYADDFGVTGASRDLLERAVRPCIAAFLRERGLARSAEQTAITPSEDGCDCLGKHGRKDGGKDLGKPSKQNTHAFLATVRGSVKANQQATAGNRIAQRNPLIRGWANDHRHDASKAAFGDVDRAICRTRWRWACRRHARKPRRWIRQRSFRTSGERTWVCSGEQAGRQNHLRYAKTVPIRRHRHIKGAANPYDPAWEGYCEARLGVQMAHTLRGRRQLLHLWQEQDGICPVCDQRITTLTGWHHHHVIWRTAGGADGAENRVLLHPECHRQVHRQRRTVTKPRPARGEREA